MYHHVQPLPIKSQTSFEADWGREDLRNTIDRIWSLIEAEHQLVPGPQL